MFTITVENYFWAPHQLTMGDGSKEAVHSHNWAVTAAVAADNLDQMQTVMDFHQLKAMLSGTIGPLENQGLAKNKYFHENNPSAENVARYVYENLEPKLPDRVRLVSISVVEHPGCKATYDKSQTPPPVGP